GHQRNHAVHRGPSIARKGSRYQMNPPVLFEEKAASNGMRVGIATLNAPQTLNGLSLEMVDLLAERLDVWARDAGLAIVVLQGAGDKAFSAGGDLHGLYRSMQQHRGQGAWANRLARDFFEREYRLDYRIHTYPKPLLCWGHGIVMGGGVGDRKSTRLNSSHVKISYAVFCLKKKKTTKEQGCRTMRNCKSRPRPNRTSDARPTPTPGSLRARSQLPTRDPPDGRVYPSDTARI